MVEKIECFHRNHSAESVTKLVRFLQTAVHPVDIASIKRVAFGEIVACGSVEIVVGRVVIDRDTGAARRTSRSRSNWNGVECKCTIGGGA